MIRYSSDQLKKFNSPKLKLSQYAWEDCKKYGLVSGTKRGIRSGKWFKRPKLQFESSKQKSAQNNSFSFGYINARSVKNKTLIINDFVTENNFDAFLLSETWLCELGTEVEINELTPPGYSFIHCPRPSGNYGGVGILYRSSLNLVRVQNIGSFETFEYLVVRINLSKESIFLICIYRPPPSDKNNLSTKKFHEEFSDFLDAFVAKDKYILIGDINIHFNNKSDSNTKKLLDTLDSRNLKQWIDVPTHIAGNTLDWLISHVNADTYVKSINVKDCLISDHFVVSILTELDKQKFDKKYIECRNLKGIDIEKFNDDLLNSELLIQPPDDLNTLANLYDKTVSELINKHAPLKRKLVVERDSCEFFDENLKEAKRLRRESESCFRESGSSEDKSTYRFYNNRYNDLLKVTRAKHIQDKLDSATKDPKKTYNIVNSLLGKETSSPVLPNVDEQTAAQTLSSYFVDKIKLISDNLESSAGDLINENLDYSNSTSPDINFPNFDLIDENCLRKIITKSKKTSCLLDPAPTKFILNFLDILIPILLLIINKSLQSGCVPDSFKKAVVRPLLKKSTLDPLICKNYRPVSNLSYLSKLLERVVADQFVNHLNSNSILDKYQSAYRTGHSTETALLKVLNDALIDINSGQLVLLVLLDLSAAFDTINHQLLLRRLKSSSGINETALLWFESYLTNRSQTVLVGSSFSDSSGLECGVPQGSVLGPILFSIYTSDLGRLIESFDIGRQFFADDSQLINSFKPDPDIVKSVVENLERCCDEIKKWMTLNRLKLNDDKTEAILLGPKERRNSVNLNSIRIGESEIEIVEKVRDLGLIIDANLSMSAHVSHIIKTSYFHLRRLGKIRNLLSTKLANAIAVATVTSRLDYCNCCLWGITSDELNRLQKLQNSTARIVSKSKLYDHITPVLEKLHWLPVKKRIDFKILCITYQCIYGNAPIYLKECIPRYTPVRSLRSSGQVLLKLPSVDDTNKVRYGKRSFQNSAPKLWNSLPAEIRSSKNISTFKKNLKTYLFSLD